MRVYITKYYRTYNAATYITATYIIRISFQSHSLTGIYVMYVDGKASRVMSDLRSFRNQDREFELYYGRYTYCASGDRSTPHDVVDLREIFYRFGIPYTTSRMKLIKDLYTLEAL